MSEIHFKRVQQRGSALLAALFLIVVLAALGAFAVRIGVDQQQTASLQILQFRAIAAANAGLESWAYAASTTFPVAIACPFAAPPPITIGDFNVVVTCIRSDLEGTDYVYDVTSVATIRTVAYGSPDFVRRTQSRRMKSFPAPGNW